MRTLRTLSFAAALVVALTATVWTLAADPADDAANMEPSKYLYVGLSNNLARIDPQTGRVWVLKVAAGVDRRAGVNDIVTYPDSPWMWTEVRIMGVRGGERPDADESTGEARETP
jgi:hypothetical protein